MARTRNLDPGRDRALHYAFTFRKRHAKRLVYALLMAFALGDGGLASLGAGQGDARFARGDGQGDARFARGAGQGDARFARGAGQASGSGRVAADIGSEAPCVACQALSIAAEQIRLLPRALNGATVLVRDTAAGLAEITGRGGRGGIHFTRTPAADDARLTADAALFAFDAPAG